MNLDVVDIGSVVPEEVSEGNDDKNPNLDDIGNDDSDEDEEFPEGQLFGNYYPDSEICKATHNPESWKELIFHTFASFERFFLSYTHDAGFGVRKASTKSRKCPSDDVVRVRYATRVCRREGYRTGSSLDPKSGGLLDATSKGRIIREFRVGCLASIKTRWCEKRHGYYIVEWRVDHNHSLTIPEHRQFINSARSINPLTVLLSKMHDQVGVPLRATYDLLANYSGGRDKVGCTQRGLQNHRDLVHRTPLKEGDGRWLYDYFMGVKEKDPTFFYKVKKDVKGRGNFNSSSTGPSGKVLPPSYRIEEMVSLNIFESHLAQYGVMSRGELPYFSQK